MDKNVSKTMQALKPNSYLITSRTKGSTWVAWDANRHLRKGLVMAKMIKLTTNFLCREEGLGDFQLPLVGLHISDLLRHIGQQVDFPFTDIDSISLRPDVEVIINGKEIWFYPMGLNTPLGSDDSVEIYLVPLGGG